mmetsp:Transcript_47819/g.72923  ORF Transcript_47819/g.72923 Transcript_47819/m.72923 type:complete len:245 (+) Transcript_47819:2-736(+)
METYVETLRRYPDSLLGAMFAPRNVALLKPDEQGEFFFDRDAAAFSVILNFYRTGRLIPNPQVSREAVNAELEYWGLHTTADDVREKADEAGDEEEFAAFGAEVAQIAVSRAREQNKRQLYPLLKRQIRIALRHAAERGMSVCTIYFSNRGHTYFGDDADGNPLYEIRNEKCSEFFGQASNQTLLLYDLHRMGLRVEDSNFVSSRQARSWLRFRLWSADVHLVELPELPAPTVTTTNTGVNLVA